MGSVDKKLRGLTLLAAGLLVMHPAMGESDMEEIVVKGDLGSLPGERVDSVFGL